VKSKIAIFLLVTYLFGATDACQLLKLPLLVLHFQKHKEENPRITLASFIKIHYIEPQPMDADYAEDMQLPFKTTPEIICRSIPSIVSAAPTIVFRAPVSELQAQPLINENISTSSSLNNVFHPPRA
jgi:hypothetical protein